MPGNLDSIRAGRGLLPKNLHWFIVAAVLAGMVVALALNSNHQGATQAAKRSQARRNEAAALAKQAPDVNAMIDEGAQQLEPPKPKKQAPNLTVPALSQGRVGQEINAASNGVAPGAAQGYAQGVRATSPIIVLSAEEKPSAPPQASERNLLMHQLLQKPQPPALSPEDRQVLASEGHANAPMRPAAARGTPGYLGQAERNEAWYKRAADAQRDQSLVPIGLNPAVAPYTIVQGTPIPAVIVSGIDSDLPGRVIARTTEDMYDSVSGNTLLIPAGSLVYGEYNNSVVMEQDRLAVAFNRIVFPNGAGVTLGAMPGIGQAGKAGVPGAVDNHFWKIFGSSMLIAGVTALVEPRNVTNNIYLSGGSSPDAAGQSLVDITRQIEQRNTLIPPTVEVAAGQRFNIIVQRDLTLAPYGGSR